MQAKKYFLWIIYGMLISAFICIFFTIFTFGSEPEAGRYVAECLAKKSESIRQKSPKLVILSGSNSLFGFSAKRLSEKYGIESVNASVHAGLGLNYILYYARPHIVPGRVFVLPLEYPLYGKPSSASEYAYLYQVAGFDPNYFHQLDLLEKAKFISQISMIDRARFIRAAVAPQAKNQTGGYQSKTLNDWGDETANDSKEVTPSMLLSATRQKPQKYSIDDSVWAELDRFVKDVDKAGGTVLLAYPNIYEGSLDLKINNEFLRELNLRANKSGTKFIGNPESYTFDESRAFDTYYHQNTTGHPSSTVKTVSH